MAELYVLTPEADADLVNIWQYTEKTWGAEQAARYLETLEKTFISIAQGKTPLRNAPTGEAGLQYMRCEHHYIFVVEGSSLQVIRILHERMDYMQRLKDRL